jgi:hypothetical protein
MMQAQLLNFGDNTRVVSNINNEAVSIGIGQIVECDIHDVHFHMIRRAIATETLMVVPKEVRPSPKLNAITALLRGIETEPYDELLVAFNKALPGPGLEEGLYRPTRDQIRLALREAARIEVAAVLHLQSKVTIHEQGDPVTRQEVPKVVTPPKVETPKETPPPKAKKVSGRRLNSDAPKAKAKKIARETSKPTIKRERL